MNRIILVACCALMPIVLAAGCGDEGETRDDTGGGSGGGTFNSSFPDSTEVGSLSTEQMQTACEEFAAYQQSRVDPQASMEFDCTLTGLFGSQTPEECATARDECIAESEIEPFDADCDDPEPPPADCRATVGQLEACVTAQLDTQLQLQAEVTCELAGDMEALQGMEPETPAACQALEEVCPGMFGEGEVEENP